MGLFIFLDLPPPDRAGPSCELIKLDHFSVVLTNIVYVDYFRFVWITYFFLTISVKNIGSDTCEHVLIEEYYSLSMTISVPGHSPFKFRSRRDHCGWKRELVRERSMPKRMCGKTGKLKIVTFNSFLKKICWERILNVMMVFVRMLNLERKEEKALQVKQWIVWQRIWVIYNLIYNWLWYWW
jgi:hypothetical protein